MTRLRHSSAPSLPIPDQKIAEDFVIAYDPEMAIDCLKHRFRGVDGYVQVAATPPDKWNAQYHSVSCTEIGLIRAFLDKMQGQNVYFTINPLAEALAQKPSESDIISCLFFMSDIDMVPNADPIAWRTKVHGQLRSFINCYGVHPMMIVDSGGGYQMHWRLEKPVTQNDCKRASSNMADRLRLFLDESIVKVDPVQSTEHLARLPGSVNFPGKKKRKWGRVTAQAKIIQTDWDARYPCASKLESGECEIRPEPSEQLARLLRTGLNHRPDGQVSGYASRSEVIAAVSFLGFNEGLADEEIFALIEDGTATRSRVAEKGDHHTLQDIRRLREKWEVDNPGGSISAEQTQLTPLDVRKMLDKPAPTRDYIFTDKHTDSQELTSGVSGVIVAPGGTGKSMILLQLAIAAATKGVWMERYIVNAARHVFFLTAEEDDMEIHRRFEAIIRSLASTVSNMRELLERNLHIYSLQDLGHSFALTRMNVTNECVVGPGVDDLVAEISKFEHETGPLIILDPLRKISAGKEDGQAMTTVVQATDRIRNRIPGATVLTAHHVSKYASRGKETSADAARGATDLVDGMRWAMVMNSVDADMAKKYGIDPDQMADYRRYDFPKSNYGPRVVEQFIRYEQGTFVSVRPDTVKVEPSLDLLRCLEKHGELPMKAIKERSAQNGSKEIRCSKGYTESVLIPDATKTGWITVNSRKVNGRIFDYFSIETAGKEYLRAFDVQPRPEQPEPAQTPNLV